MTAAQDVLLLIARVLMATMFFISAQDKFRLDATEVQQVASLHLPVPALFLVLTGVFEGAGGIALVFGAYTQLAAGALALFTLFVSLVFVRFWSFKGPLEMRTMMKNTFVGNVAITGGLVYLAVLGPGGLALTDLTGRFSVDRYISPSMTGLEKSLRQIEWPHLGRDPSELTSPAAGKVPFRVAHVHRQPDGRPRVL